MPCAHRHHAIEGRRLIGGVAPCTGHKHRCLPAGPAAHQSCRCVRHDVHHASRLRAVARPMYMQATCVVLAAVPHGFSLYARRDFVPIFGHVDGSVSWPGFRGPKPCGALCPMSAGHSLSGPKKGPMVEHVSRPGVASHFYAPWHPCFFSSLTSNFSCSARLYFFVPNEARVGARRHAYCDFLPCML